MKRIEPKLGQESVWDYPRPPRVEPVAGRVRVIFGEVVIADTHRARRVLETSHPPTYYIPPSDVRMEHLQKLTRTSLCEWKGRAVYYTVEVGGRRAEAAAWGYPSPTEPFVVLKDHVAFYPSQVDACYVGEEHVEAQAGDFYGGWITSNIVGPFKGGSGTRGW